MTSNPFTSDTFTRIWAKHFGKAKIIKNPSFAGSLGFLKPGFLPVYYNTGGTHTKGMTYSISSSKGQSKANGVYVIYDVHPHHQAGEQTLPPDMKCLKVPQYPGFTVNLEAYQNLEAYLVEVCSVKSRKTLQRKKRKLEKSFPIRYKIYYAEMDPETYEQLFREFREMLEKRFDDKKEENNILNPDEWQFFKEVSYPMILEKKACMLVCYNDTTPIGVMLNFLSEDVLFQAITGFDIDYYKYNVGTVTIMELVSWCLGNNIKFLDFSKGYYEYKTHWGTFPYTYEYHIWFRRGNPFLWVLSHTIAGYFRFKQFLRDQKINELKRRIVYLIGWKDRKQQSS